MLKRLHTFLKPNRSLNAPVADHRSVDQVLQNMINDHQVLIDQLFDVIGMDDQQFQAMVVNTVQRYATCVFTLPASRIDHHREEGGLFRHGLEVALFASRLCYDRFVGGAASGEERRHLKRGWRYASLLTGLFQDVGYVTAFDVRHQQSRWNPYTHNLADWAKHQSASFECHWNASYCEATDALASVYLFQRLVPTEALTYLHRINKEIMETVIKVLGNQLLPEQHFFARLIDDANLASVNNDREALRKSDGISLFQQGHIGVDKYIVDAMRQLIQDKWSINQAGARVWIQDDAVYLDWPVVCEDIKELLARDAITIPRSPETIAEILVEHDYLMVAPAQAVGHEPFYWEIEPALNAGHCKIIQAVRLTHRSLLIKPGMTFPELTLRVGQANKHRDFTPVDQPPASSTARGESLPFEPANSTAASPTHPTTSVPERFFATAGNIGSFLIKVARDINAGKRAIQDTLFWSPLGLCMIYPETIEQFGLAPRATLTAMREAGWLEAHPDNESRFVLAQKSPVHNAEVQVFVLRRKVGQLFEQLMEQGA